MIKNNTVQLKLLYLYFVFSTVRIKLLKSLQIFSYSICSSVNIGWKIIQALQNTSRVKNIKKKKLT